MDKSGAQETLCDRRCGAILLDDYVQATLLLGQTPQIDQRELVKRLGLIDAIVADEIAGDRQTGA